MNIDEYKNLVKKGEKEVATLKSKNIDPYLPTLEDMTANVRIVGRRKVGIVNVPINLVVGTTNAGRSNAFTRNFLPLLEPNTEFSSKWINLYNSMEEEGLRDPILAFEYMGRFYVQEGNKRVSVSKCMDIPYIEADVTRVMPERTEEFENKLYYEFSDFYEKSGINSIHFSKLGCYTEFAEKIAPGVDVWDEDTRMEVQSLYTRFSKQFELKKGDKLAINVSDALLLYVNFMGYEDIKDKTADEIKEDINKMWKEFELQGEEKPILVSSEPFKEKPNLIASLFMSKDKNVRIAFIYRGNIEQSAWAYAHDLGRHYIEEVAFPGNVSVDSFFDISTDMAEDTLEKLCNEGYDIIFDTAPQHNAACAKVAIEYPNVKILNCSLNASTKAMRSYYLRTYETKYLMGIIAGAVTKNNRVSYVCDYPVYGTIASINAFALGARTVNPSVEIYLSWTSVKDSNPQAEIDYNGCDVVSNLDWSSPRHLTKKYGLYLNENNEVTSLAAPLWDWGKLYEAIIKSVMDGSWKMEENAIGSQSLNYWWGLKSGAVDLIYSHNLPELTKNLVDFLKKEIANNNYNLFNAPLTYQDGSVEYADSFTDILSLTHMSKLLDNIHGFVPSVSDVRDQDKSLTKVQGVIDNK